MKSRLTESNDIAVFVKEMGLTDVLVVGDFNFGKKEEVREQLTFLHKLMKSESCFCNPPQYTNKNKDHPYDGGFLLSPLKLKCKTGATVVDIPNCGGSDHFPVVMEFEGK